MCSEEADESASSGSHFSHHHSNSLIRKPSGSQSLFNSLSLLTGIGSFYLCPIGSMRLVMVYGTNACSLSKRIFCCARLPKRRTASCKARSVYHVKILLASISVSIQIRKLAQPHDYSQPSVDILLPRTRLRLPWSTVRRLGMPFNRQH